MLKKLAKFFFKTILWIVLSFIALDLLIVTLLIIPPVQQFVVLKASKILTNLTGGEITVDKIYLSPTLRLTAKNFAIKDHHFENMIFASTLKGRINLQKTGNGLVCLSFAELVNGEVVLRKYADEEDVNISIWARDLKKDKEKKSNFKLLFENIQLHDVRFVYISDDKRLHKEDNTIDYAFFELQHIHLDVDDFLVFGPDIKCKINSLTLSQHTGFEISNFSGFFRIYAQGLLIDSLHFSTPNSLFNGDFAFRYQDFKDFSDFVNLINFDTKVKCASIAMKDVIYFAPTLEGMDNRFLFSGYVGGVVNHLQTKNIYLKYKQETHFAGDLAVTNVLDFKNSSFNIFFKDANINFSELKQFKLPQGKTLQLPKETDNLIFTRITGDYKGSLTKFNTNIEVKTNLGAVAVNLNTTPKNEALHYSGSISCNHLDLGKLTNQPYYFNKINLQSTLEGEATNYEEFAALLSSASVRLQGNISDFGFCGNQLNNIDFKANYLQQKVNLALNISDSLVAFNLKGSADFANNLPTPAIDAVISNANIKLHEIFVQYPHSIDTTNAIGFEKVISKIQRIPHLVFTLDSISIDMSGNRFDNLNGFVRVDFAKLSNGEKSSRIDWLRFNTINKPHLPHQYIIHSNAVNLSLKTDYDYSDFIATLSNAAVNYLPEMFKNRSISEKEILSSKSNHFIDFGMQLYYTQNLFGLLLPHLSIASNNATLNVHLGSTREKDSIQLIIPRASYTNFGKLNNLKLKGKTDEENMLRLHLQCDSISIEQKNGNQLTFSDISFATGSNKKEIQFATSWRNPKMFSINEKNYLSGILFADTALNPSVKITNSELFIRESLWRFIGNHNIITFCDKNILFNHCILSSKIGTISVNGELSKQENKRCNISFDNFDISLLNSFTERLSMSFAGNMALLGIISGEGNNYTIEGKTFIKDFVFNNEPLGDLFLDALVLENGDPNFIGGILSKSDSQNIDISNFSYKEYQSLPNRIIELTGVWGAKTKELRVHADIDTLKIGFLSPFLASFSDVVTGDASGRLDFIMSPDSLYFDGKVKIRKAQLGIEPLNTVYTIANQEIVFNQKGIIFNQILLKDKFNNNATLSGYVHHTKFKDFIIDLNISTDRILALNTPKKMDASFFGDGFVSGDISIQGDTKQLVFSSPNIKTLSGSTITFPITSTSTVSSSQGIYFISNNPNKEKIIESSKKSSTTMNFDFVFDITRDADVKLELEPIDGILKCKTSGKLHLLYNTNTDDMDLNGILSIVSGKFHMSLKNFFPRDFTIVEGGTISFSGPLTSAQLNVSALYQKTASLTSLSSALSQMGRTEVAAYLGLTGNLMNPNPSFSFAFPRLNNEDQLAVFRELDTANYQYGVRQFFSFVFLNTFISSESNTNAAQQSLASGVDFVTGMLNSFLSGQLNNVNIGINYINSQENSRNNYKEYSVNAAVNLYNDRLLLKTSLGVGYDDNNDNSFVGDAIVNYIINENWNINFFYFNDQTSATMNAGKPQQGGGISLKFQQDFNNRKDFVESWRIKKREKSLKNEK